MIQSVKDLNNIFKAIDSKASNKINAYLIGGGALMQFGLKGLTKDIDLVVKSKKEYEALYGIVKLLGYKETALTEGINRLAISAALQKEDARIDMFLDKICGKMSFSNAMVSRSKIFFEGKNLSVYAASIEDIFVFKTITDREGDKADCEAILQQSPNWNTILGEIREQSKKGEQVWLTYINERLLEFESKGYAVPILKQIEKGAEQYYKILEKKLAKK
jgi:hypothetical protein